MGGRDLGQTRDGLILQRGAEWRGAHQSVFQLRGPGTPSRNECPQFDLQQIFDARKEHCPEAPAQQFAKLAHGLFDQATARGGVGIGCERSLPACFGLIHRAAYHLPARQRVAGREEEPPRDLPERRWRERWVTDPRANAAVRLFDWLGQFARRPHAEHAIKHCAAARRFAEK